MKYIDCTTLYLPFLCVKLKYSPTPLAQCITCVDEAEPVAGVVYDGYNDKTISAHVWIRPGTTPSRAWYGAIFDYPFNRLGVHKIIGQVNSSNDAAVRLDSHFGFIKEAVVKDYYPTGDLVLYTMTKDQCRILNSPMWAKVVDLVRRAA